MKTLALLTLAALPALCLAQQPTLPSNYQTVLTNPSFNVIRVHYGPHEKVPVHDHPATPTVYVYLNDSSPVRISHDEEAKPFDVVRPPTHTGAFRVNSGRLERHTIENLGDKPSDFLRVELPALQLGDKTLDFRGPAPTDTTHNLSAKEFNSDDVTVVRTICIQPTPCNLPPAPMTSVLIAIAPTTVTANGRTATLNLGEVFALDPNQPAQIAPVNPQQSAHILQILTR